MFKTIISKIIKLFRTKQRQIADYIEPIVDERDNPRAIVEIGDIEVNQTSIKCSMADDEPCLLKKNRSGNRLIIKKVNEIPVNLPISNDVAVVNTNDIAEKINHPNTVAEDFNNNFSLDKIINKMVDGEHNVQHLIKARRKDLSYYKDID